MEDQPREEAVDPVFHGGTPGSAQKMRIREDLNAKRAREKEAQRANFEKEDEQLQRAVRSAAAEKPVGTNKSAKDELADRIATQHNVIQARDRQAREKLLARTQAREKLLARKKRKQLNAQLARPSSRILSSNKVAPEIPDDDAREFLDASPVKPATLPATAAAATSENGQNVPSPHKIANAFIPGDVAPRGLPPLDNLPPRTARGGERRLARVEPALSEASRPMDDGEARASLQVAHDTQVGTELEVERAGRRAEKEVELVAELAGLPAPELERRVAQAGIRAGQLAPALALGADGRGRRHFIIGVDGVCHSNFRSTVA
jgi:hypothetical protein